MKFVVKDQEEKEVVVSLYLLQRDNTARVLATLTDGRSNILGSFEDGVLRLLRLDPDFAKDADIKTDENGCIILAA